MSSTYTSFVNACMTSERRADNTLLYGSTSSSDHSFCLKIAEKRREESLFEFKTSILRQIHGVTFHKNSIYQPILITICSLLLFCFGRVGVLGGGGRGGGGAMSFMPF